MNEEVQGPKSSTDNSNVHLTDRYGIYGVFGSSGVMFNRVRARIDTLPVGTLFDDIIVSDLRLFSWGLIFAQTQPSPRAVCVFFPCSTYLRVPTATRRYPTQGYQGLQGQATAESIWGLVEGRFGTETVC